MIIKKFILMVQPVRKSDMFHQTAGIQLTPHSKWKPRMLIVFRHGLGSGQDPGGSAMSFIFKGRVFRNFLMRAACYLRVMGFSRGEEQLQILGMDTIVGIHKGHPFSPSNLDTRITGRGNTGIGLMNNPNAGIAACIGVTQAGRSIL